MLKKLFLCTTLAIGAFAAKDPIVAEINGKKILKSDLDKAYLLNKYVVSHKAVTMKKVLTDLINKEIGIERAKKAKLDKNKIVKDKMEEVLFHAQISKDLEPKFKRITVTDKDVQSFYSEYPEYRTAHILLRVRVAPSKLEVEAAQKKIFELYDKAKKDPSKFAELANKFSQSPNNETGGDVGFKPAFFMTPEYFKAVNGKDVGYITPPVRTQYGYHIVKVLGVKKFSEISKPVYQKFVYDRKRDRVISDYFAALRKNAKIKVYDPKLK